jgi:DNA-binding NarL/FixJ family response regulator
VATLSPRELDILTLAARALSNAQIASRLYLAEATVKRHLSNSFAKLGAVSRVDAVNKAVAAALIPTSREYLNSPQGTPG